MSANSVSRSLYVFLFCILLSSLSFGQDAGVGAFIIVSREGDVQVLDAAGQPLPAEETGAGKTLIEGQKIKTGDDGKMILLLSNGSLTTLQRDSELVLEKFRQKPFVQEPNKKIKDLPNEPSNSETKLKLSHGELMFNVKKLNAGSTFEIESPIGLAGIRGTTGTTEARLDPQTGSYTGGLDMLEGNVNFQVGDQNFDVGGGNSMDVEVNNTGDVVKTEQKPVDPAKTQEMTEQKQESEDNSQDVTVEDVSNANKEAEQKAEDAPKAEEKKEEESTEEKKEKKEETAEEKKEEPTEEKKDEPADDPKDEPKDEPSDQPEKTENKTEENNNNEPTNTEATNSEGKNSEPAANTAPNQSSADAENQKDQLIQTDDQVELAQDGIITDDPAEAAALIASTLTIEEKKERVDLLKPIENTYPEVTDLLKKNIDAVELDTFKYVKFLDDSTLQGINADTDPAMVDSLVQTYILDVFTPEELDIINSYSTETGRALVNDLDLVITQELLKPGFTEDEIVIEIANLTNPPTDQTPTDPEPVTDLTGQDETQQALNDLNAALTENGNEEIFSQLLEMGDGTLDADLQQLAEETNHILSDQTPVGTLEADRIFLFDELKENPFYSEPLFLFESLVDETNLSAIQVYASRSVGLEGTLDLSNLYTNTQESKFAITAQNELSISGDVTLQTGSATEAKLALIAVDSINISENSSLFFEGDDLIMGSWGSIEIVNVSMESGKGISINSLENLTIRNSDLLVRGGDSINLRAQQEMLLNNVNFSNNVKDIYMQAITIDLQNINFPDGSMVNLSTLYGGIDGKYPTFPNQTREIGRVNFLENVRYNQNLLNNRTQFDTHGQNIFISPIGQ